MLDHLAIADRLQRGSIGSQTFPHQGPDLLHQPGGEHGIDTCLNAALQVRGLTPEHKEEFISPAGPGPGSVQGRSWRRDRLPGHTKDFQRPDHTTGIAPVDPPKSGRITLTQFVEQAVEGLGFQELPDGRIPGSRGVQPADPGAEIKAGSPAKNGEFPASRNLLEHPLCLAQPAGSVEGLRRPDQIEEVMRNTGPFGARGFGGAEVETPEHLHGIRAEDLAVEAVSQFQGDRGFPGGGGPCEEQRPGPGPDQAANSVWIRSRSHLVWSTPSDSLSLSPSYSIPTQPRYPASRTMRIMRR